MCTIAAAKVQRNYNCYNVYFNECLHFNECLQKNGRTKQMNVSCPAEWNNRMVGVTILSQPSYC